MSSNQMLDLSSQRSHRHMPGSYREGDEIVKQQQASRATLGVKHLPPTEHFLNLFPINGGYVQTAQPGLYDSSQLAVEVKGTGFWTAGFWDSRSQRESDRSAVSEN